MASGAGNDCGQHFSELRSVSLAAAALAGQGQTLNAGMARGSSIAKKDSLAGQLLVAMPQMPDPRFARSVMYLCAHSADGAMGMVVNRLIDSLTFESLLEQLGIEPTAAGGDLRSTSAARSRQPRVRAAHHRLPPGLEPGDRGRDRADRDHRRAQGDRARRGTTPRVLALGYAGWAAGQLDAEIQANGWLLVPADLELVFDPDDDSKWARAMAKLGIDLTLLSSAAGHA